MEIQSIEKKDMRRGNAIAENEVALKMLIGDMLAPSNENYVQYSYDEYNAAVVQDFYETLIQQDMFSFEDAFDIMKDKLEEDFKNFIMTRMGHA